MRSRLQPLHVLQLLFRQQLGCDFVYSQLLAHVLGNGLGVSRQKDNRSKDCQRRSRSDTASSRHNDHGNRRAHVVSDEECQDCGGKSKIDEVSGQTIGNALNRRTGLLGLFHGLVDGAGVYLLSWVFLHRHRFASDGCLIDKGMAAHHRTIHRNSASRLDENNVTHQHLLNPDLSPSSALIHRCSRRQQIDQVANLVPPAAHGEPLEDFRHEHEQSDHQCRENFPDRQRRQNRDGHREFHRHSPFENILNRFAEYRVSANDGANYACKDKRKTRVYSQKPKYARCDRHKADSNGLAPIQTMLVRRRHPQSRSPCLPLPGERQTHAFPMSHRHPRLLVPCPPSSPCPAFPPPLRPPRSALDSTAISDKTSRYRSVLRRRRPEGNPWRGLGPGHGTGYVPRPARPSSHSALLGKPPPTEAPRCTLALPAVRARRLPLAREFDEPGPRVFLCLSPCVPCSLAPILSPSIVYKGNYNQALRA